MGATVAIGAGGRRLLALNGLGVQTAVVSRLLLSVAVRTGDFGRQGLVGEALTSEWQSTQVNMPPCIEFLNLSGSTCRSTGLPLTSWVRPGVL